MGYLKLTILFLAFHLLKGKHRLAKHWTRFLVRRWWSHSPFLLFISCYISSVAWIRSHSMPLMCSKYRARHGMQTPWPLAWEFCVWYSQLSAPLPCVDVDGVRLHLYQVRMIWVIFISLFLNFSLYLLIISRAQVSDVVFQCLALDSTCYTNPN